MPLHVRINSESYDGTVDRLGAFYISRQENLKNKTEGVHRYAISHVLWPWRTVAEFSHEYSDGANGCTQRALEVLPRHLLETSIPESPVHVEVSLAGYYGDEKTLLNYYINKDGFSDVDIKEATLYGVYKEVWPFDPIATFSTADNRLASLLKITLTSTEGMENNG